MRLENWILHKHLCRAENAGPVWKVAAADLVGRQSVNSDIWGMFCQCLSRLFLKEFTVLQLTTLLVSAFQVVVILIG